MKRFFQGNEELVDNYFHCLKVWSPWLGIGCFGPPMVRQPRWFVFESDSLLWKSLEKHVFDINLLLFSQSDSLVWIINMVKFNYRDLHISQSSSNAFPECVQYSIKCCIHVHNAFLLRSQSQGAERCCCFDFP